MYWIYPVAGFVICFAMFWLGVYMGRRQERRRLLKHPVFRRAPQPQEHLEFAPVVTQEAEDDDHASVQRVKMQRRRDSF